MAVNNLKREIPIYTSIFCGVVVTLAYFIKWPLLDTVANSLQSWTVLISAFLLGVGMINMLTVAFRDVKSRRGILAEPIILTISMVVMFVVTLFNKQFATQSNWLFNEIYSPLATAVFSLLMFSIATATFRALRVKSLESLVLVFAAVITMLGIAPIGEVIWDKFPVIYKWLVEVPDVPGRRGIIIGTAIGGMAASLRAILGLERRYIGVE